MFLFSIIFVLGVLAFWVWGRMSLPVSLGLLIFSLAYFLTEGKYDFSPDVRHYPRDPIVFRIDDDARSGTAQS
ncbi:hypothetical protein [Burkholderia territorii]|uniref:hypothetical protein n=1 Tax=Burkholderia territorii TaxID=1503055 RepID=UPI000A65BDDC|nr:hypothetical protein [Burkholderia territorii]